MKRVQYRIRKDAEFNLIVKLSRKMNIINLYDALNEENATQNRELITVTGTANSRLNEIRSYDINRPFIEGLNGVLNVFDDLVVYQIDGITYRTVISSGATTYTYQTEKSENINCNLLPSMFSDFVEKPRQTNVININRNEQSVLDIHNRINTIKNFSELNSYGNNFF